MRERSEEALAIAVPVMLAEALVVGFTIAVTIIMAALLTGAA